MVGNTRTQSPGRRGADWADQAAKGAAGPAATLPQSAAPGASRERANDTPRRPQRHDDDGGRCRHRLAALDGDGEHAAAAIQLPAACRARRPNGPTVLRMQPLCAVIARTTTSTSVRPTGSRATRPHSPSSTPSEPRSSSGVIAAELPSSSHAQPRATPPAARAPVFTAPSAHAREWPVRRAEVEVWLSHSPEVERVVRRLTALTGLGDISHIVNWARNDLVAAIDGVVADPVFTQAELSERLANGGVLPMFGFPTRVRKLYRTPVHGDPRESEISDRPLSHAVSTFSPGSQIVKDGWIHTANGFAAYSYSFGKWKPVNPLPPGCRSSDAPTADRR